MRKLALILLLALPACGIFTKYRTVYVPPGASVRLREDVEDVDIWALDETGKPVPGTMTLHEGWYVVPAEIKR